MLTGIATYEEVIQLVQQWSPAQRFSLVQAIFQSLAPEIKLTASQRKNRLQGGISTQGVGQELSVAEFELLADEFSSIIGSPIPVLSDYAISRAGIYEEHA